MSPRFAFQGSLFLDGVDAEVEYSSPMPRPTPLFAFDLDGTVTTQELLPLMAKEAGCAQAIAELTALTLSGAIPFARSFRRRFAMLRHVPLERMRAVAASVPLDPHISAFIRANPERCVLVTGNLDLWIEPLAASLGCPWFSSQGVVENGELRLVRVLDKAKTVRHLQARNAHVTAIGESVGDIPMFRAADACIAYAGVHAPVPGILALTGGSVADGETLCRLLEGVV